MLRQHNNRLSCVEKTLSLQSESRGVDARTEELAYSPERVTLWRLWPNPEARIPHVETMGCTKLFHV